MSLRTSFQKLIRRDPERPSLRERATELRGVLPSRRAIVAGTVAAAVPLPTIASTVQPNPEEAAFLALIPAALPILRRLVPAQTESRRLHDEAAAVADPHPGFDDRERLQAYFVHRKRLRDANGGTAVYDAWNALGEALTGLVEGYDRVPMRTPTAILFKIALDHHGEWWGESALDDLRRLAAERFDLSDDGARAA